MVLGTSVGEPKGDLGLRDPSERVRVLACEGCTETEREAI